MSVLMSLRFALPAITKLWKSFNLTIAGTNILAGPVILVLSAIITAIGLYISYLHQLDNAEK